MTPGPVVTTFYGDTVAREDIAETLPPGFVDEFGPQDLFPGIRIIAWERPLDYPVVITVGQVYPETPAHSYYDLIWRRDIRVPHRDPVVSGKTPSGSVYTVWLRQIIALEIPLTPGPKHDIMVPVPG